MKTLHPFAIIISLFSTNCLSAHCQVPCGVYGDSARFTQMLEDQTTIAKAIARINDLAGKKDGKSANQLAPLGEYKGGSCQQNTEDYCRIFSYPKN